MADFSNIVTNFTIHQTCRTCLQNLTDHQNIFPVFEPSNLFDDDSGNISPMQLFKQLSFSKLKISRDDGLPQQICAECMTRLMDVSSFRNSCERSQNILEKFFKSVAVVEADAIEQRSKLQQSQQDLPKTDYSGNAGASAAFEFLNIENAQFDSKIHIEIVIDDNQALQTQEQLQEEQQHIINENIQASIVEQQQNDDDIRSYCVENDENWEPADPDYKIEFESDYDRADIDDEDDGEKTDIVDDEFGSYLDDGDDKAKLECYICGKVYKREAHLIRHVASHRPVTSDIPIVDGDVSRSARNRRQRNKNKQRHYIFVCNKCGKRFSKSKALQHHENEAQCITEENPQCRFCKEVYPDISTLEEHLTLMHPRDRPHMCPICKKTFQSVSNRNTHLQSHNKVDSYKCSVCGQGFKSKVYLNKHIKSVHTVSNHDCPHCLQKFDNTVKYEYHLKSHDPNKKYKCKFCDKSFLQHHHLSNHERTHTGHRPFLCNICGKDFKQECNFKLHLRIHSGVRPYICSVCGKDFIQRGSFVMHMRQHSGVRPYQCEHCGKDFVQKSSLTVHLRTHTGERPYKCDSCDKAFVQAQQLKYHRHSAHGGPAVSHKKGITTPPPPKPSSDGRVYPYCCPLCNKGFKLPSSLSSHMKIHNEERKHVCTQCGNSFKRAEHLRIHINGVHLKQKPYACDLCKKTFAQSGDRNIHMRRHTGEKPHQCSYCKKNFRLLKAMRAHMRIHTGEKPYSCEFCKMNFMTYTALATHTMKHENDNQRINDLADNPDGQVPDENKLITVEENMKNDTNLQIITLAVPSSTSNKLSLPN